MFKLNYVQIRRHFQKLFRTYEQTSHLDQDYPFSRAIQSRLIDRDYGDIYDLMERFGGWSRADDFFHELHLHNRRLWGLLRINQFEIADSWSDITDSPTKKLYHAIDMLIDEYHECKSEYYDLISCSCCGDYCQDHSAISAYNGDEIIGECCLDQYSFCDDADTYFRDDDYESWDQYQEQSDEDYDCSFEGVYRYDCDPLDYLGFMHTKSESSIPRHKQRWSGLEIEMEATSRCPEDLPLQIRNVFSDNYCIFKSDGSLSHGFELVSAPCTLAYHKERIEELFDSGVLRDDEGKAFVRGWNTDTAGMHIHLDRKMLSSVQLGKLLVFINNEFNRSFIERIAGRSETFYEDSDCTSYAVMRKKKVTDGGQRNYNKYEAVNVAHSSTVELRIFRSNLTKDGILRALEFSYALVDFLQQNTCRESDQHYKEFLKWFNRSPQNRASYPYFYGWLVRKGYLSGTPSRAITRQYDQAIDAVVNQ